MILHFYIRRKLNIICYTMLYIILQYGWEAVLIQRKLIGFEVILENILFVMFICVPGIIVIIGLVYLRFPSFSDLMLSHAILKIKTRMRLFRAAFKGKTSVWHTKRMIWFLWVFFGKRVVLLRKVFNYFREGYFHYRIKNKNLHPL